MLEMAIVEVVMEMEKAKAKAKALLSNQSTALSLYRGADYKIWQI
jgi:hypothetical protein